MKEYGSDKINFSSIDEVFVNIQVNSTTCAQKVV
jgi:hypothetical protein